MMERNKSLYWTLVTFAAVVLGLDIVLFMRMPDTSLSRRILFAALVSVLIIFNAVIMYLAPKMEALDPRRSSKRRKHLITPVPDPDGLRWITSGVGTLLFAVMWGILTYNLSHSLSIWALIIPLVIIFLLWAVVDLTVNIRLFRAAGRPITWMVVLYTLGELVELSLFFI